MIPLPWLIMKLSKIYTNSPRHFHPIRFNRGLNVVLGKITKPEDENRDSHNLGKSLLIDVIDFCLLKGVTSNHFTKKLLASLDNIDFYIEVLLDTGSFLTVKRGINNNTKVCFKESKEGDQSFVGISEGSWDHFNLSLDKSKDFLNGKLALEAIRPFTYRKGISYFLRKQKDYVDVFQVEKFSRGKRKYWKPYIGKILGFSPNIIEDKFNCDDEIKIKIEELEKLKRKLTYINEPLDKLRARKEAEEQRVQDLETHLDSFDFKSKDLEISEEELQELDKKIAYSNNEIYNLNSDLNKISESIKKKVSFKTENIKKIFQEVGIFFQNKMLKNYEDLENFNKKITQDRNKRLKEERKKIEIELISLKESLESLNSEKVSKLSIIRERDSFKKYKKLQSELVKYKGALSKLNDDLEIFEDLRKKREKIDASKRTLRDVVAKLVDEIEAENNTLINIRSFFREIVNKVLNTGALLYVEINNENNIDFFAHYTRDGDPTSPTSEGEGTSYHKFLCAFFDLAVLRSYRDLKFYHFIYHDGILEGLDDRKKILLIETIKDYTTKYNIQYILTVIDSDLPNYSDDRKFKFSDSEIIKELTDEGSNGRLFNCPVF